MEILPYALRKIWRPEMFQGGNKKGKYFEGWYFKLASPDNAVVSIIPGVSITSSRKRHAFIQVVEGKTAETHYVEYPYAQFHYSKNKLELSIGSSYFSRDKMKLDIHHNGLSLTGEVEFSQQQTLPVRLFSPGIMGWYALVPFMECYHGVVSLDHRLQGSLTLGTKKISFTNGRGYIEKDWGRSFPSSWIWLQSNSFDHDGTSCMVSIARIPWIRKSFIGFLGLLSVRGSLYKFTTYTGARASIQEISDRFITICLEDKKHILKIRVTKGKPSGLKAPVNGAMSRTIHETVSAEIGVTLLSKAGAILFEGQGRNGGLEIAGDTEELV